MVLNDSETLYDFAAHVRGSRWINQSWQIAQCLSEVTSLLKSDDAQYRAVACEFLGCLPLDSVESGLVSQVGKLLSDNAAAFDGAVYDFEHSRQSPLGEKVLVKDIARAAVEQMTTFSFPDRESFDEWWAKNSDYRKRIWYWSLRWGVWQWDRETILNDLSPMTPQEGLRLLLLCQNSAAKILDAGLPAEALERAQADKGIREAFHYEPTLLPAFIGSFIRAKSLEAVVHSILRQEAPWPETRNSTAMQSLFRTLIPVLPLSLYEKDVKELESILEAPKGCLANANDLQAGLARAIIAIAPRHAEDFLLEHLRRHPHQPEIFVELLYQTGLKHWQMIHSACQGLDKVPVLPSLGSMRSPEAAAAILQWLIEQDWLPKDPQEEALIQPLIQAYATAAINFGGLGSKGFAKFFRVQESLFVPFAADSSEERMEILSSRVRVAAELQEYFTAAANPQPPSIEPQGDIPPAEEQAGKRDWPRSVTQRRLADERHEIVIRNVYLDRDPSFATTVYDSDDGLRESKAELIRERGKNGLSDRWNLRYVSAKPIRDLESWCNDNAGGGCIPLWDELLTRDLCSPNYRPGLYKLIWRVPHERISGADIDESNDIDILQMEAVGRSVRLTYGVLNMPFTGPGMAPLGKNWIKHFRIVWDGARYCFFDERTPEKIPYKEVEASLRSRMDAPIRLDKRAMGMVKITPTTAHCMSTSRLALRVYDQTGRFIWEDQQTLDDLAIPLAVDLKGDGTQQIIVAVSDHGVRGILLYELAGTLPPATQPATHAPWPTGSAHPKAAAGGAE